MKLFLFTIHFIANIIFYIGFAVLCIASYFSLFVEPDKYFWYGIIFVIVLIIGVRLEWWYANSICKIWRDYE